MQAASNKASSFFLVDLPRGIDGYDISALYAIKIREDMYVWLLASVTIIIRDDFHVPEISSKANSDGIGGVISMIIN